MKIAIIGGGPSGLYSAYLIKRHWPDAEIEIYEQNPERVTTGFGVVFSDRALDFLNIDDPETFSAIHPHMEVWRDLTLDVFGTEIIIDGIGFAAISRLHLLEILTERVRSVGVEPNFGQRPNLETLSNQADLIIAADGVNSAARNRDPDQFGSSLNNLTNRFAWYGTDRPFDTLTQSFRKGPQGLFNAHHYRYTPGLSTFIVETSNDTWQKSGFEAMSDEESREYCEAIFADVLDGHTLTSNKTLWRQFPVLSCKKWYSGKTVLLGDAVHTAHFSIGSGTRLALEDAIALQKAMVENADATGKVDIPATLSRYQNIRQPIVEKITKAAGKSADWYENFGDHLAQDPWDFAMSYICRAGRIDQDRLSAMSPAFAATYSEKRGRSEMA